MSTTLSADISSPMMTSAWRADLQVKALQPNSWYVFRVAAASDAGPSEWSHTASYCTATAPPGACPPPSAIAAGFGALQVRADTDIHSTSKSSGPTLFPSQLPVQAGTLAATRSGAAGSRLLILAMQACRSQLALRAPMTLRDISLRATPSYYEISSTRLCAGVMGAACGRSRCSGVQLHAGMLTRAHPRSGHVAGLAHGLQRRRCDVPGGLSYCLPRHEVQPVSLSLLCPSRSSSELTHDSTPLQHARCLHAHKVHMSGRSY